MGPPDYIIRSVAPQDVIEARYKTKNETEEIGEEQAEELKAQEEQANVTNAFFEQAYADQAGRVQIIDLETGCPLAQTMK